MPTRGPPGPDAAADDTHRTPSASNSPAPSTCSISSRSSAITSASMAGLDEDQLHWVSVAVRESVINAIKHGNKNDQSQARVRRVQPGAADRRRRTRDSRRDQGEGFEPEEVADPLAPENMLKSSGRGIFLIRNFMDDVQLRRVPEGGMEIRMVKQRRPADACSRDAARPAVPRHRHRSRRPRRRPADAPGSAPAFASTRRAPSTSSPRSTSRSSGCSARSSPSAFPITTCSPKSWAARVDRRAASLGVRSARRHDQLRARPADLLRVARARDRRRGGGRRRLRSESPASCSPPKRGVGALLNGAAAARRRRMRRVLDVDAGHRASRTTCTQKPDEFLRVFGQVLSRRARCAGWARRRSTSARWPRAAWTASGKRA